MLESFQIWVKMLEEIRKHSNKFKSFEEKFLSVYQVEEFFWVSWNFFVSFDISTDLDAFWQLRNFLWTLGKTFFSRVYFSVLMICFIRDKSLPVVYKHFKWLDWENSGKKQEKSNVVKQLKSLFQEKIFYERHSITSTKTIFSLTASRNYESEAKRLVFIFNAQRFHSFCRWRQKNIEKIFITWVL